MPAIQPGPLWRASEERLQATMDSMLEGAQIIGFDWRYLYLNEAAAAQGRKTKGELLGQTMMAAYPGIEHTALFNALRHSMAHRVAQRFDNEFTYPDGSSGWFDLSLQPVPEGLFILSQDISDRKRAEATLRNSERRFRALIENSSDAITLLAADGTIVYDSPAAPGLLGYGPEEMIGRNAFELVHPEDVAHCRRLLGELLRQPGARDCATFRLRHKNGAWRWMEAVASNLLDEPAVRALVVNYRDISEHKLAEEGIQRRLDQLASLRAIDVAIASSLDVRLTLRVLLQQVTLQLGVDAADVMLLNPSTQTLEYAAGLGFRTAALEYTRQRLGEGNAGRAALERRLVHVPDLRAARPQLRRTGLLVRDEFVTYFAMPLIAKGRVQGVLEVFHRTPLDPDPQWLSFLEALVGQAAIAVDNATLFEDLQQSNTQLAVAYDATIEGWSAALDLRDKETEGHSQRVTALSLRIAEAMGFTADALVHMRRGALLHDIGKMGVPDAILYKPAALTEDEWAVMHQHPAFAYNLLSPIAYLQPALDIPYCHHEKWDGTGYPRGLKGEQIPLAARIFAVADVWDALRSDRPYRAAWSAEKALAFIREQAGRHFDPRVVDTYMQTWTGSQA